MRDPARRAALGDAAFARLRDDFSMQGGIDKLEQRFRTIVGDPARERSPRDGICPVAFYAPLKSPNHPAHRATAPWRAC
jgi:hypothetical protein